jgi:putative hydrolases of HD superfamily
MIKKALLETIYDAASMQRWNDKVRPVDLRELDKQAHKMIIAYVIGKEEERENEVDWCEIIEGGIFEFLQRLILTDLKPQIFNEIKKDRGKYKRLNEWVFKNLEEIVLPLEKGFYDRLREYFVSDKESRSKKILNAAHFYATKWEFGIVEQANPGGYEVPQIRQRLEQEVEKHYDLPGLKQLVLSSGLRNFVNLCGQLRFQLRWSHINMTPRTSVLGHMLIVAMLAYLSSLEIDACERRRINNYFTGLFHDLPEVLTRDIISPVKRAIEGLEGMIKQYEKKQMEKEVYPLLPEDWHSQMKMFTENEFKTIIFVNGKTEEVPGEKMQGSYNKDKFNPRDGELVKAIDDLAAFMEAYLSRKNGIKNVNLEDAEKGLRAKYQKPGIRISGIDFAAIYADFEK